jgi:CRP-like cAMP-binding protein
VSCVAKPKETREYDGNKLIYFHRLSGERMKDKKIDSWIEKSFDSSLPFLDQIPSSVKNLLIERCEIKEYDAGQTILRRGVVSDQFYMLQAGKINECGKKIRGNYTEIHNVAKGSCFGGNSILSGIPITRTYIAESFCTILMMKKDKFIPFLIDHPGVLVVLYRIQAEQVRRKDNTVDSLLRPGVQGNLATQSFMDICQSFLNSSRTGIVTLEHNKAKAVIGFNDGQICYAKSPSGEGPDVLNDIITWEEGKFSYENTERIESVNIEGDTMSLLLDALRILDEAQK